MEGMIAQASSDSDSIPQEKAQSMKTLVSQQNTLSGSLITGSQDRQAGRLANTSQSMTNRHDLTSDNIRQGSFPLSSFPPSLLVTARPLQQTRGA